MSPSAIKVAAAGCRSLWKAHLGGSEWRTPLTARAVCVAGLTRSMAIPLCRQFSDQSSRSDGRNTDRRAETADSHPATDTAATAQAHYHAPPAPPAAPDTSSAAPGAAQVVLRTVNGPEIEFSSAAAATEPQVQRAVMEAIAAAPAAKAVYDDYHAYIRRRRYVDERGEPLSDAAAVKMMQDPVVQQKNANVRAALFAAGILQHRVAPATEAGQDRFGGLAGGKVRLVQAAGSNPKPLDEPFWIRLGRRLSWGGKPLVQ
ncbi:hypothetical protein DFJ73DRAFT_841985 [Zopfochytrium polystomum]|nr:hypothetical protein DFJ73DRAFT_841985 [Zopfochytrium polystomum]